MLDSVLQIPDEVPHPSDGRLLTIETPFEVLFFMTLPILVIVGVFFWRKNRNDKP